MEHEYFHPSLPYDSRCVLDPQQKEKYRQAQVNFLAVQVVKSYRKQLGSRPRKNNPPLNTLINRLPTELICEILGYLHPTDLLNLTKLHAFISTLLKDETVNFVWKSSFANHPDIPVIPEDVFGLKWADLLFNPLICEKCGGSSAIPNVTFLRRLCESCNSKEFTEYDDTEAAHLLSQPAQLIAVDPYNDYGSYVTSCLRSKAELLDIEQNLLWLQNAPDDLPEIEGAFQEYESRRYRVVSATINKNHDIARWANSFQRAMFDRAEQSVVSILLSIKERFISLGFDPRDIRDTQWNVEFLTRLVNIHGIARLSRRRWVKIRPFMENDIALATKRRLARERKFLISRRMDFVKKRCRESAKIWLPATWAYLPPFYVVQHFDAMSRVINAPHDRELEEKDLLETLKHLPDDVERWHREKMEQLVSIIPDDECDDNSGAESKLVANLSALNLATSVFHCFGSTQASLRMGGCLIGWDGAGPHLRCRSLQRCWGKRLHFSRRGHDAAISLVRLAGLDPLTAKIWDMDTLDRRFVCMNCPLVHANSRVVYDWTEAVYHGMLTEGHLTHMTFSWGLLGPEAEADVKCREDPDPYIWENNWICNHCSIHFENRVTRRDAINHARESHDISRPVNNIDYLYFVGDRSPRTPALFPVVDAREHLCLRCAPTKRRLYRSKTVRSHIRDAHGISAPVEPDDCIRVDIFSTPFTGSID